MYNAFELHIWDVGVNFVLPFLTSKGVFQIQPQKWIYLLMVPIVRLFPSPFSIIIFQDMLISTSGIFVFLVARQISHRNAYSLVLSGLYLFNYFLFGAAYFPNHYQIFFSVFFIIAIYFLIKGKILYFSIFIILSAFSSNLAAATSGLFLLVIIVNNVRKWVNDSTDGKNFHILLKDNVYIIFSFLIISAALLYTIFHYGSSNFLSGGHIDQNSGIMRIIDNIFSNWILKLLFLLFIFAPFGLGIVRSKYSFLLLPFMILTLTSNFQNFFYFGYQYVFDIGVILFLSFIDYDSSCSKSKSHFNFLKIIKKKNRSLFRLAIIILILDLFLLPFGPFNHVVPQSSDAPFYDYELGQTMHVTENDKALSSMIHMIPVNSSVLIQENMPQLTNRAIWYEPGSYSGHTLLQYILTDPYSYDFELIPPNFIGPYTLTMEQWFNKLYDSGNYGIIADYQGSILLQLGYHGKPQVFSPYDLDYQGSSFHLNPGVVGSQNAGSISVSNLKNGSAPVYSNSFFLPPGVYTVTFFLKASNTNIINHLMIGLNSTQETLNFTNGMNIQGSDFETANSWQSFSYQIVVNQYYLNLYFALWNAYWNGSISIEGVMLKEES